MSGQSRFERIAMVAAVVSVSMVAVVAFALRGCGDRDVTALMPVPDSVAQHCCRKMRPYGIQWRVRYAGNVYAVKKGRFPKSQSGATIFLPQKI